MIISASRRTDIPAFYAEWFVRRIEEKYVLVRNPYDRQKLMKIELEPDKIDCIVFWTKDAEPMLEQLEQIEVRGFDYYFQYTITGFGKNVERGVPDIEKAADTFIRLSEKLGPERVDWRFDPIMVNQQYPLAWHVEQFEKLCEKLAAYTQRCIISFIDAYAHIRPVIKPMEYEEMRAAAEGIAKAAAKYQLPLFTCSEEIDLHDLGIKKGACIDKKKVEDIIGCKLDSKKDVNQRKACGCIESIDIGAYNTCGHDCTYCYGCVSSLETRKIHKYSPGITGYPTDRETITERQIKSNKVGQISLFDE